MKTSLVAATGVVALAVAGCGSSNSSSSNSTPNTNSTPPPTAPAGSSSSGAKPAAGSGSTLKISADPNGALKYTKTALTAKAGNVTITMANPSSVPHGVSIKGSGVNQGGNVVNHGGTSTVTAKLKPGTYEFFCPVPGHEQAGMKGTLTVK
jgi:plastocyanin